MTANQPQTSRLQSAAMEVGYELSQLTDMPAEIQRAEAAGRAGRKNACLESMLLHARNLIEFLLEGQNPMRIHRFDFAPKWSPPKTAARKRLLASRDMLNSALVHLGWDRVVEGPPDHYPDRIAEDLVSVFAQFVEHLEKSEPDTATWFRSELDAARTRVTRPAMHLQSCTTEADGLTIIGSV